MAERKWYYMESGQRKGPVSTQRLNELWEKQIIKPNTSLWTAGWSDWRPAKELFGQVKPATPTQTSKTARKPTQTTSIKKSKIINSKRKECQYCKSEIPIAAETCNKCGERVEGKPCPDCFVLCPDKAKKCRWCGYEFAPMKSRLKLKPFEVKAKLFPTILLRGRFLCQSIRLDLDKIVIRTPGIFGLSVHYEESPWQKVAGFDYRSGIFWDLVHIETRGQQPMVIGCLAKEDGERIRSVLQQLEK